MKKKELLMLAKSMLQCYDLFNIKFNVIIRRITKLVRIGNVNYSHASNHATLLGDFRRHF